jgi:hypothetical protein
MSADWSVGCTLELIKDVGENLRLWPAGGGLLFGLNTGEVARYPNI